MERNKHIHTHTYIQASTYSISRVASEASSPPRKTASARCFALDWSLAKGGIGQLAPYSTAQRMPSYDRLNSINISSDAATLVQLTPCLALMSCKHTGSTVLHLQEPPPPHWGEQWLAAAPHRVCCNVPGPPPATPREAGGRSAREDLDSACKINWIECLRDY